MIGSKPQQQQQQQQQQQLAGNTLQAELPSKKEAEKKAVHS